VYLLNRNVNNGRQWIECDSVSGNTLSVLIANTNNRLKVLRDYKHYYKVRSYVLNEDGNKIHGPDPMPTYTWTTDPEPYVKWGARQISTDEFAAITALSIGTGMNWAGSLTSDVPDRHDAGSVTISEPEALGYNRDINFNNSKPYFVTVHGHLYGQSITYNVTPRAYGAESDKIPVIGVLAGNSRNPVAKESTLTITGPGSEVNNMYSGTVVIRLMWDDNSRDSYRINYNGSGLTAVDVKHNRTCFTFAETDKKYKRTRDFDWSPSGGIAGTSPSKWWYPLDGSRAGWD
jgi:hypothetical protein